MVLIFNLFVCRAKMLFLLNHSATIMCCQIVTPAFPPENVSVAFLLLLLPGSLLHVIPCLIPLLLTATADSSRLTLDSVHSQYTNQIGGIKTAQTDRTTLLVRLQDRG